MSSYFSLDKLVITLKKGGSYLEIWNPDGDTVKEVPLPFETHSIILLPRSRNLLLLSRSTLSLFDLEKEKEVENRRLPLKQFLLHTSVVCEEEGKVFLFRYPFEGLILSLKGWKLKRFSFGSSDFLSAARAGKIITDPSKFFSSLPEEGRQSSCTLEKDRIAVCFDSHIIQVISLASSHAVVEREFEVSILNSQVPIRCAEGSPYLLAWRQIFNWKTGKEVFRFKAPLAPLEIVVLNRNHYLYLWKYEEKYQIFRLGEVGGDVRLNVVFEKHHVVAYDGDLSVAHYPDGKWILKSSKEMYLCDDSHPGGLRSCQVQMSFGEPLLLNQRLDKPRIKLFTEILERELKGKLPRDLIEETLRICF
jgi:hypothetical protein